MSESAGRARTRITTLASPLIVVLRFRFAMHAFRFVEKPTGLALRAVFGAGILACMLAAAPAAPGDESARATARLELLGAAPTGENLVRAIAARHQPLVDLFLAARTDVNEPDANGRTALLAATLTRDAGLTARLLAAGADPGRADTDGVTPLMAAAAAGHLPTIAALRAHGAPLDATDAADRSALHYAIAAGQLAVIEQFFQTPADITGPLRDGGGLAELACATGDRRIIELVLSGLPEKVAWAPAGRTLANQAVETRDTALLRLLFARFSGPPAPSENAQPWLAYAVAAHDLALLEMLLACGADPNATLDQPGDTALRHRIAANFMRSYIASEPGMTPLMLAAGLGQTDAVKMLLAAGANRNAGTRGKATLLALYFAAWAASPESVQALLGHAPPRDQTRIEISLNGQHATFIKDGETVLQTEISTGRSGFDTKPGEYVITDKHLTHRSTMYPAEMPFFMRLSCQAFGLHEGYVTGRPASHGCIRLPKNVAQRLFKEAPVGTWVSITR